MSNKDSQQNMKSNDKGKNILIIVLVVLVILSGIKLYIDYLDRTKKTEEILLLSEDNSDLNLRLDSITYQLELRIQEIEKLGGDVDSLVAIKDQLILERNSERNRSAAEIAKINQQIDDYSNLLTKKDADILKLREINQRLFSENQDLKVSKAEVEEEVVKLNIEKQELEEKVNLAAVLRAENIVIAAVNARGRERTDGFRNRQLEKLKISFNLADNPVAEHGTKDIYVQVTAPNKQVIFDIAKGSGTFNLEGKEEFYTAKQDIIFNNTEQQLTYYYEKGSDYNSGIYQVQIFADGYPIGSGTFEIR